MIFGHDFKYIIPEMDRLLGAAADMGIHFSHGKEDVSPHKEGSFVVQVTSIKTGDTSVTFAVAKVNPEKREAVA